MPICRILSAVCLLCVWVGTAAAQPTADTLTSIKDNTLIQDAAGALSNGAGQHFFAGRTGFTNEFRRGLIAFDLTGIPIDNSIDSVKLILNMSRTIAANQLVRIHRVTANWGEGTSDAPAQEGGGAASTTDDATWLHTFYDTAQWASLGGDFIATASATTTVGNVGFYTWGSTAAMVTDVTGWRDDPSTNFGWIVIGNEAVQTTAKRFDTRENPIPANRPTLIVFHSPPVVACCIGTAGDFNNDAIEADPIDLSYLVDFLFAGGPGIVCPEEGDINGDSVTADPIDLSYLVDFLFAGGPGPTACP